MMFFIPRCFLYCALYTDMYILLMSSGLVSITKTTENVNVLASFSAKVQKIVPRMLDD